jgi:hypothetical protein
MKMFVKKKNALAPLHFWGSKGGLHPLVRKRFCGWIREFWADGGFFKKE